MSSKDIKIILNSRAPGSREIIFCEDKESWERIKELGITIDQPNMRWIPIKERHAPPMKTVILYARGKVMVGWNESIQPEEVPVYVSWETFPESEEDDELVTHWMPLPEKPHE